VFCPGCGQALDVQGNCTVCALPAAHSDHAALGGDTFPSATTEHSGSKWKSPLFGVLAIFCSGLAVWLSCLRTLRRADTLNAESFGYLIGSCLVPFAIGIFITYLIKRARRLPLARPIRFFSISAIALLMSLLSAAGSRNNLNSLDPATRREVGDLLRQAGGAKKNTADMHWWDAPIREMAQELISRNQQYISEIGGLDSSAIKNLYATDSYAGKAHMGKVVVQLRAASEVDAKYSSVEPIFKKMRERVASVNASELEKSHFLDGFDGSLHRSLEPRNKLMRSEKEWMDSSIQLYEFMMANSDHYSIRDAKLYFDSTALMEDFEKRQSQAVALHQDFLKAKAAFEEDRKNSLNQLGVSPSEFTPSQLGKLH